MKTLWRGAKVMPLKGMAEVKKMIAENKKKTNEDMKSLYFVGLRTIIKGTPVDEGRARNNWFLTVGSPSGLVGRADSTRGGGSDASLMTMPESVLNKKIYFTNNLPYIETLEYGGYPTPSSGTKTTGGFSKQAPNGWVRKTLKAMAKKIRSL